MSDNYDPYRAQLQGVQTQLETNQKLLDEIGAQTTFALTPRERGRLQLDAKQVREDYDRLLEEWESLRQRTADAATPEAQTLTAGFAQLGAQITEVQQELRGVRADIGSLRSDILGRFDTSEQTLIGAMTQRLDATQLQETQAALQLVDETPDVSELQPLLAELTALLPALRQQVEANPKPEAKQIAQAIRVMEDPKLEFKHKIKATFPLVPGILSYEAEMGLGNGANLRSAYDRLRNWVQARRAGGPPP